MCVWLCVCVCASARKISEGGHGEEKRWREKCVEEKK